MNENGKPNTEQLEALRAFAARYGRGWKEKLWAMWVNGGDDREPGGCYLRQVRNTLGAAWLLKFKLPREA